MAVRNFWVDANIDGAKTELGGGPRSKDGGMTVKVKQRQNNSIVTAFTVECYAVDGKLTACVYDNHGDVVSRFQTER